jgi:3-hydroxyisobutyrate dehydrogenase
VTDRPSIGWIGTGVMGAPMAGHLLQAGYPLTVFNRTRGRAEELLSAGAAWADGPAEVAAS